MKLTPMQRAWGAMLGTNLLFGMVFATILLLDRAFFMAVPVRITVFGVVAWALSMAVYFFVYHRYMALLPVEPARHAPTRQLILAAEQIPPAVWLAAVPPLLVAATLWWMTVHASELPWRYSPLRYSWDGPVMHHPLYRKMVLEAVMFTGCAMWIVACGLAVWHGAPRSWQVRRGVLLSAVLASWLALVCILNNMLWDTFRVTTDVMTASRSARAVSLCAFVLMSWRWEKRYPFPEPDRKGAVYFEPDDPAFIGERGLNLANRWTWGLAAALIGLLALHVALQLWSYGLESP